jgi:hypothetical protein
VGTDYPHSYAVASNSTIGKQASGFSGVSL